MKATPEDPTRDGTDAKSNAPTDPTTVMTFSEPKTVKSRRQISLARTPVDALRQHRVRQNEERLVSSLCWKDNDLVFPNRAGRPMEATNLPKRSFKPLLQKAGLPDIPFHSLRHSAAKLLLTRNVHTKVVSETLGHSRIGVTLDIYSHVLPDMQREAADAMELILEG